MSSTLTAPAGVGPRTIVLPGNGTQAASYVLPPGLLQYVQSVLAEVDATAAGSVRPTLSIAEQSGVVIATKRQSEAIPGGGTGSATWALRLTDDPSPRAAPLFNTQIRYVGAGADDVYQYETGLGSGRFGAGVVGVELTMVWTMTNGKPIWVTVFNADDRPLSARIDRAIVQKIGATTRESLQGLAISIAPGATGTLPWTNHLGGSVILDRATLDSPTPFVTDTYAISVTVEVG